MKEYRQNSHTLSLVIWTVLCTLTALVLFVHSHKVITRALKVEEILGGVALLIFGPAALTAYLLRARHVWVSVDQIRGIVVSGRRVIAWNDIRSVERRLPAFRRSTGPTEITPFTKDVLSGAGWGCADGCIVGASELLAFVAIIAAAVFAVWLICFVFVPLIVLPALEVFAPFGDRIRIRVRGGGSLLLRDLRDADEFLRAVELRAPVTVR
jgi:hypothetical protein